MSNAAPQKIPGKNDYIYKGCVIGRYENVHQERRWQVQQDGAEIAYDLGTLNQAAEWVNFNVKEPF